MTQSEEHEFVLAARDVTKTYRMGDVEARVREVALGESNGLETEVVSGLEEGETVIAYPCGVREGVSVRARR